MTTEPDVMDRLALLEKRVDALEADRDGVATLADARFNDPSKLTKREREVLYLVVVKGYSIKQVAYRLGVCQKTAENHMASLRKRLGVHDRGALFAWADEHRNLLGSEGGTGEGEN